MVFFQAILVYGPVVVPFYISNGLNYGQILQLQAIFALSAFLFEIPSGIFSDLIGRKKTLVISCFFSFLGYFVAFVGIDYWHFIIFQLLAGIGVSFQSGTFSAYIYDHLLVDGRENESKQIFANVSRIMLITGIIISPFAGLIVKISSLRTTLLITSISYSFAFCISLFFDEPISSKTKEVTTVRSYLTKAKNGFLIIFRVKVLKYIILEYLGFVIIMSAILEFIQPFLIYGGLPIEYFGI